MTPVERGDLRDVESLRDRDNRCIDRSQREAGVRLDQSTHASQILVHELDQGKAPPERSKERRLSPASLASFTSWQTSVTTVDGTSNGPV